MLVNLTKRQEEVLDAKGHVLVIGGPGSGKTTVSILKALQIIHNGLPSCRRVLFLGFARATVSRVLEAIHEEDQVTPEVRRQIQVDTYHAFFWRLIRTHGCLLGTPRRLKVLTPANEAIALADIRKEYKPDQKLSQRERREKKRRINEERRRLAMIDGAVCFDMFATMAGDLLHGSAKIRHLISNAYPVIILDEFQDTAPDQWRAIRGLGRGSELMALADPEQRIFDFIGADPKRLQHFEEEFALSKFDLSDENHRSLGTDLAQFGNDILSGIFTRSRYQGLYLEFFEANKNQAVSKLHAVTLQARRRLVENGVKDWSLAILVPTKSMTRLVCAQFSDPIGTLPKIEHRAVVDMEAIVLAAEVIAYMLQGHDDEGGVREFVKLICCYFKGRGADKPTKGSIKTASQISMAFNKAKEKRAAGKGAPKNSIYLPIEAAYESLRTFVFTGNPDKDWVSMRKHLETSSCSRLEEVAHEVKDLQLLNRGTKLRSALSQSWRDTGRYAEALGVVRSAFMDEHFSTHTKQETGVVLMNMHKAKGKQFDEVIIFEGWPRYRGREMVANIDRLVKENLSENIDDQACQNLRVSITRAKQRTTILTPRKDHCVLLNPR